MRILLTVAALLAASMSPAFADLESWNESESRQAIVDFVAAVSDPASPGYVPPNERIAVFDNDGTLWSEQPLYFQLLYVIDQVRAMAPAHPEWSDTEPYRSAIAGDMEGLAASGKQGLMELLAVTHAGMTVAEFQDQVVAWLAEARHPETGMAYTDMVYQPMLELLDYLRANGFQTWIVSGGGQAFMRPWTERVYGIPPEQVIGSHLEMTYEVRDGEPVIVKQPEIALLDDKAGKPVGIQRFIGRRPILAGGNSDGDFEMLEWTTAGEGERLGVLIHHTDGEREWAYDRDSHVGGLERGLDEAAERGWVVVDMARDWTRVYPD